MSLTVDAVALAKEKDSVTYSNEFIRTAGQEQRYQKLLAQGKGKEVEYLNRLAASSDKKDARRLNQLVVTEKQAENKHSNRIAKISQEEFARYLQDFRPIEDELIGKLDADTTQRSMETAQVDAVRSREALERMRERYGSAVTPEAAASEARMNALSGVLGQTTAGSSAVLVDRDNRMQTLSGLMNTGNTIRQQAMGNLTAASSAESARLQANEQAKAQAKANKYNQTAAMISSAASMAAMIKM